MFKEGIVKIEQLIKINKIEENFLRLLVGFLALLRIALFIVVLFYILSYVSVHLNKDISDRIVEYLKLALEYLKVVIWPYIVIVVCKQFDSEMKNFITRIKGVKGAGVEVNASLDQDISKEPMELPDLKEKSNQENIEGSSGQINENTEGSGSFSELSKVEKDKINETAESLAKDIKIEFLEKSLDNERVYGRIYGSQIELLEMLRSNVGGIAFQEISAFYDEKKKIFPVLSTYTIGNYLKFLESNGLVKSSSENDKYSYAITTKGIDFLSYIEAQSYLKVKLY